MRYLVNLGNYMVLHGMFNGSNYTFPKGQPVPVEDIAVSLLLQHLEQHGLREYVPPSPVPVETHEEPEKVEEKVAPNAGAGEEKKVACDICGAEFTGRRIEWRLRQHRKKVHQIQEDEPDTVEPSDS